MSKVITPAALRSHTLAELHALYRSVEAELMRSAAGSAERRNALASLENIRRAICALRLAPGPRL